MRWFRRPRPTSPFQAAAESALTATRAYEDNNDAPMYRAIILAGTFAAQVATEAVPVLTTAKRLLSEERRASATLRVFALAVLSGIAERAGGDLPDDKQFEIFSSWAVKVLAAFPESSGEHLEHALNRYAQFRHEAKHPGDFGAPQTFASLLLSDIHEAMTGEPLLLGIPRSGYPYSNVQDLMERGGARPAHPGGLDVIANMALRASLGEATSRADRILMEADRGQ